MKPKVRKDKVVPELAHLNPILKKAIDHTSLLDPLEVLQLFDEIIKISSEHKEQEVFDGWQKYTNKYFKDYYGIDSKTLNKWIELYCPQILDTHQNLKRILFNKKEWNTIMKKIGRCDGYSFKPYSKKEISLILAKHDEFDSSNEKAIYNRYASEINRYLKPNEQDLKILTPVTSHKILKKILGPEFNPYFHGPNIPRTDEFKANWMIQIIEGILMQSKEKRHAFYVKAKDFFDDLFREMKEEIERKRVNSG